MHPCLCVGDAARLSLASKLAQGLTSGGGCTWPVSLAQLAGPSWIERPAHQRTGARMAPVAAPPYSVMQKRRSLDRLPWGSRSLWTWIDPQVN